jgi:hypothetical protein
MKEEINVRDEYRMIDMNSLSWLVEDTYIELVRGRNLSQEEIENSRALFLEMQYRLNTMLNESCHMSPMIHTFIRLTSRKCEIALNVLSIN